MTETVLITGAAGRLGKLIAERLASEGCFVWIHYRSHESEAILLRDQIKENGGQADCVQADLSNTKQIDKMLEEILHSKHRKITTLINNASLFLPGTLEETSSAEWDQVINTNLKSIWYLSVSVSKKFPTTKRIISIGDANLSGGYAGHAVYGLSKFALKYLNEQMASAFSPRIRTVLLSPGMVLQGEHEPDEIWNHRLEKTLTDNSEIVQGILSGITYLMTDPGINGSEMLIDNGLHLN